MTVGNGPELLQPSVVCAVNAERTGYRIDALWCVTMTHESMM